MAHIAGILAQLGSAWAGTALKIQMVDENGSIINFADAATSKIHDGTTLKVYEEGSGFYVVWSNQWPDPPQTGAIEARDNADDTLIGTAPIEALYYTAVRGDNLDYLDKAISALNDLAQSDVLSDATPFAGALIARLALLAAGGAGELTAARAGYLDNLSGHTPQTGDSYARLGAPAGASIAADMQDIQSRLPAALVGGRMDSDVGAMQAGVVTAAAIASGAIDDDALAADVDTYQAKIWLDDDDDSGADRYGIVFHKNGQPVTSGITNPTLWVYSMAATPVDLVGTTGSPQALTEAGSTGTYFHNETTGRIADGALYMARVQATIGGSAREWYQPLSRDT